MTCPNCKCFVPNTLDKCQYCGCYLDTGRTVTVSICDHQIEIDTYGEIRSITEESDIMDILLPVALIFSIIILLLCLLAII